MGIRPAFLSYHDGVIKWKHFPPYWPFVPGIHRSPVNSPQKGQWRGALKFSLISTWTNGWVNNRDAGDLRRHWAHYVITVMHICKTGSLLIIYIYNIITHICNKDFSIVKLYGHFVQCPYYSRIQCRFYVVKSYDMWMHVFVPHNVQYDSTRTVQLTKSRYLFS